MNKQYIEAPNYSAPIALLDPAECLFLGGSITGARNWQKEIIDLEVITHEVSFSRPVEKRETLQEKFHIFNPRREDFDVLNSSMEQEQIAWEYASIHKCKHILFWFSHETLAPITLFELGSALHTHEWDKIHIGVDPEYKRKNDVLAQVGHRSKYLAKDIVFDLPSLVKKALK